MKYSIFILVCLFIIYCKSNTNSQNNDRYNSRLKEAIQEFHLNRDSTKLIDLYQQIFSEKNNNINYLNPNYLISMLMILNKYDHLDYYINNKSDLDPYLKANTITVLNYHRYKDSNLKKAQEFIAVRIKSLKDSIESSPKDSLMLIDYFMFNAQLNGKTKAISELKSLKDKKHSELFYQSIEDNIKEVILF